MPAHAPRLDGVARQVGTDRVDCETTLGGQPPRLAEAGLRLIDRDDSVAEAGEIRRVAALALGDYHRNGIQTSPA